MEGIQVLAIFVCLSFLPFRPEPPHPAKKPEMELSQREEHDFLRKHDIQQHKVHVEEASMPGLTDDLQTRSTKRNVPVCTRR